MQCALDLCLLFYPQWTLLWTAFCVCVWCCNHSCSCTPKSLSRCLCLYCNWDLPSSAVHSLSQSGYWAGTISGELISAFHCKLCNTVECFDEIIVGFNFSFSLRFSYVLFCEAFSLWYYSIVFFQVLMSEKLPFHIGGRTFKLLLDIFLYHDLSVKNFIKALQVSGPSILDIQCTCLSQIQIHGNEAYILYYCFYLWQKFKMKFWIW